MQKTQFLKQRSVKGNKTPGMRGAEHFPAGRDGARRGQKSTGRGVGENLRGEAKKRVNRLIQKFDKSTEIVMEIFVLCHDISIKENIASF